MSAYAVKLLIALLTGFIIVCSGKESVTSVDKRMLIAEPLIKQGHRPDILDGLKPDAKILDLSRRIMQLGEIGTRRKRRNFSVYPRKKS